MYNPNTKIRRNFVRDTALITAGMASVGRAKFAQHLTRNSTSRLSAQAVADLET